MNFSFYFLHACFYLSAFIFFISRLPLTLRVPGAGRVAFSPTVLLSQWLNIKRWQIPPLCSPPSLVLSPITPLFSPLILTASFSSSCSLPHHPLFPSFSSPLSLSTSLYFPSTLFFITSGPFPRASTRSPWWLKGYPIAVSCCVKVKVFPAFHQWTFPFSPLPFSRECASLAALLAVYTKVAYSFIFSQFSLSSVPPVFFSSLNGTVFEANISKSHCWLLLLLQLKASYWCIEKSDFILLLASIILKPFISWPYLTPHNSCRCWDTWLVGTHWESDENVNKGTWMLLWAVLDCCWDGQEKGGWVCLQCCYSASSSRLR